MRPAKWCTGVNHRNGYRPREWDTRAETVELAIPGKTLVLVHGAWHGKWCWDRVIAHLSDRKAVTVDLPSVGDASVGTYDDARVLRETVARIDGPADARSCSAWPRTSV